MLASFQRGGGGSGFRALLILFAVFLFVFPGGRQVAAAEEQEEADSQGENRRGFWRMRLTQKGKPFDLESLWRKITFLNWSCKLQRAVKTSAGERAPRRVSGSSPLRERL